VPQRRQTPDGFSRSPSTVPASARRKVRPRLPPRSGTPRQSSPLASECASVPVGVVSGTAVMQPGPSNGPPRSSVRGELLIIWSRKPEIGGGGRSSRRSKPPQAAERPAIQSGRRLTRWNCSSARATRSCSPTARCDAAATDLLVKLVLGLLVGR